MINPNALAEDLALFVKSWGEVGLFSDLALRLFAYQYENNDPYRRFCDARGTHPRMVEEWQQIPAAPADAFRAQVLSCSREEPAALFYTSGTTAQTPTTTAEARGRGVHRMDRTALELYRLSLQTGFRRLAARGVGLPLRALVAPYPLAPHSSLSYMVSSLAIERDPHGEQAETAHRFFWKEDGPDLEEARYCLTQDTRPVLIFTTAFALLELLQGEGGAIPLPPGSMVIETGGFKGRSRTVEREELYQMASSHFQIPLDSIGSEYGMCEMASQFYDWHLGGGRVDGWKDGGAEGWRGGGVEGHTEHRTPNTQYPTPNAEDRTSPPIHPSIHPPIKVSPPWVRTVILDPVTGLPAAPESAGILRHYDLCNFNSVQAITTADIGVRAAGMDGFILQGRLSGAPARGCSLTIEEWMERRE